MGYDEPDPMLMIASPKDKNKRIQKSVITVEPPISSPIAGRNPLNSQARRVLMPNQNKRFLLIFLSVLLVLVFTAGCGYNSLHFLIRAG